MRTPPFRLMIAVLLASTGASAFGQVTSPDGAWTLLPEVPVEIRAGIPMARPNAYAAVQLNQTAMDAKLLNVAWRDAAGSQPRRVTLPMPDGTFAEFDIKRTALLDPDLQSQVPYIKTYSGHKVGQPSTTIALDTTELGFRAQIIGPNGVWIYVDPVTRGNTTYYASYHARDMRPENEHGCETHGDPVAPNQDVFGVASSGESRRVFRLAMATTGEFTQYYGGTQSAAMSAVTTVVNRATQIFENEFSISFQLVANNMSLIYLNAATDPYTNEDIGSMLGENQDNLDTVIGTGNYDIGHALGTENGGVAYAGVVCDAFFKASGISSKFGLGYGINAPAETLTVVHEMGHQFNSPHSWNVTQAFGCSRGQWGNSNATEPGAGSTIMSYGGLCGPDEDYEVGGLREPFYHANCRARILKFLAGLTCGDTVLTNNEVPKITQINGIDLFAPSSTVPIVPLLAIPSRTPIYLRATASDDSPGQSLTFTWDQMDVGPPASLTAGDTGAGPLFRPRSPSSSDTRTIPPIANLLAGTNPPIAEALPVTTRLLRFRCTARDSATGGAAAETADVTIVVYATPTPFQITYPSVATDVLSGTAILRWDTAGTNVAPISTPTVRILLSTDGGQTWPTVLAAAAPNVGSASVVMPSITSSTARIKIEAVQNAFFAVSKTNFQIAPGGGSGGSFEATGPAIVLDNAGNGNSNGRIDPGESSIELITTVSNFSGALQNNVTGILTSLTPTVAITTGVSTFGNLFPGAAAINSTRYVIRVSPSHPCGAPVNLQLFVTSSSGGGTALQYSLPTGLTGATGVPIEAIFAGPAVGIPDQNATGIDIPVDVVADPSALVGGLTVRIDGTNCFGNNVETSTTVGLNHAQVGQLTLKLISPAGTVIPLMNTPGLPPTGTTPPPNPMPLVDPILGVQIFGGLWTNNARNICQLTFDQSIDNPPIQSVALQTVYRPAPTVPPTPIPVTGPLTGRFIPVGDLRSLKGEPVNGIWKLRVIDNQGSSIGSIRGFRINITPEGSTLCQPVAAGPCSPADIADGVGTPLPPYSPFAGFNPGVDGGDFDCFFNFYFEAPPLNAVCDIADGIGDPLPPFGPGGGFNPGVDGGDFDCFFNFYFNGCL